MLEGQVQGGLLVTGLGREAVATVTRKMMWVWTCGWP